MSVWSVRWSSAGGCPRADGQEDAQYNKQSESWASGRQTIQYSNYSTVARDSRVWLDKVTRDGSARGYGKVQKGIVHATARSLLVSS